MTDIAHISLPVRFDGGRVVEVEQDSRDHIADRVQGAARCPIGWRDDDPKFGVPQDVFNVQQVDMNAVNAGLAASEPMYAGVMRRVTTADDLRTDRLLSLLDQEGI